MTDLFIRLFNGLPISPSHTTPNGLPSRGWTMRPDRLNANAVRFDWIHGSTPEAPSGDATARAALRQDVLAAAARIATDAGFRVKPDGTGLMFVAAQSTAGRAR